MTTDTDTDWVTYTLDEADRLAERQTAREQAQQTTPEPEGCAGVLESLRTPKDDDRT